MNVDYLKQIGILEGENSSSASGGYATANNNPTSLAAPAPDKKADKKGKKDAAAKAAPVAPATTATPVDLSKVDMSKLSKEERTALHKARREAEIAAQSAGTAPAAKKQLTKAERRAIQEAQRKKIEDKKQDEGEKDQMVKDLMLQGLTEEQARDVAKEIEKGGVDLDDDDEEDDADDDITLMGSVKKWMDEVQNEKITKEHLKDFNLKVRFQGHVDSVPPDHVLCILKIICIQVCNDLDMSKPKMQPTVFAKKIAPGLEKWSPLLNALLGKINDVLDATDSVVRGVQESVMEPGIDAPDANKDTAVVGFLMGVRDSVDIEDDDLLTGCKRIEQPSTVMLKFIEHLEESLADSGEESDDSAD